jgi:hypothetical protein
MTDAADSFTLLPLHDASLNSIRIDWPERLCVMALLVFLRPGADAQECELRFTGVDNLVVPHRAPWGPSSYVNEQRREGRVFVIEMQSGDELRIEADRAELVHC